MSSRAPLEAGAIVRAETPASPGARCACSPSRTRSVTERRRRADSRWACASWRSATCWRCCCAPVAMIFYRTFEHGLAPVWKRSPQPNALHASGSIELVAIAVPLNTVFGIGIALLLEPGRLSGSA